MCLAVPAKVIDIEENQAKVYFGEGLIRSIRVDLIDSLSVGEYVMVHAGYAIERISEEDALESTTIWQKLLEGEIRASDDL